MDSTFQQVNSPNMNPLGGGLAPIAMPEIDV